MRRQLVLVTFAVSSLITLAFVIPLGFLTERTAEDRAIDAARADASSIVPALVGGADANLVATVAAATAAGREGRMTIALPDGRVVGEAVQSERLEDAMRTGRSAIGDVPGGAEVIIAIATGPDDLTAIRVFVPESTLHRGRAAAWAALGAVGVALIGISVVVADRLSRQVVRPVEELAVAAERLGAGELGAAVDPTGPDELRQLGETFNDLGGRVAGMLDRERELVAELSHRLRTPLTHITLRIAGITDEELRDHLEADVNEITNVVDEVIHEARGHTEATIGCDAIAISLQRAAFWEVLAVDSGRAWDVDAPGGASGPVAVGASQLAAAIDVLIENVFRHTPDGTPVTISALVDGSSVHLSVDDGGPGFPPDAVERGQSGGGSTGLGLDIARQLAQRAGGTLQITRSSLGGAKATLSLPMRRSNRGV